MTIEELREKWSMDAGYLWGDAWPRVKSDIEAMIASEREACAKIAESMTIPGHAVVGPVVQSIAAAIRER